MARIPNRPKEFRVEDPRIRQWQIAKALRRMPLFATRAEIARRLMDEFPQLRFEAEERWGYMTDRGNGSSGITFDTEAEARAHHDPEGRPLVRYWETRGAFTSDWEVMD